MGNPLRITAVRIENFKGIKNGKYPLGMLTIISRQDDDRQGPAGRPGRW